MLKGFCLFRAFRIRVIIDYSWAVFLFLLVYLALESYNPQPLSGLQRWSMGISIAILFFLSVLVHELAHSIVSYKHRIGLTSVRLYFFGGIAQVSSEPRNGRHEFLIAIVGPAASLILGILFTVFYVILAGFGIVGPVSFIAGILALANIALAFFNMIPGLPMDGGRILRAVLWERWDDLPRATKVASHLGDSLALTLIFMGVLQLFINPNFLMGLFFILLGFSVKQASPGGYQFSILSESLTGIPIMQVMTTKVARVDWLTSIEEFVREYVYRRHQTYLPVYSSNELLGMVSLAQTKTIPKDLWGFKQVRDIMIPIEQVPHLNPSDDAAAVLKRMISEDQGPMPVLQDGQIVGIVSSRDILKLLSAKSGFGEHWHTADRR